MYTGVAVLAFDGAGKKTVFSHAVRTKVYVHGMDEAEIRGYVDTGEPMDKAGAYGIQGAFAAFIDRIDGSYCNLVGLPVSYIYQVLKQTGILKSVRGAAFPHTWERSTAPTGVSVLTEPFPGLFIVGEDRFHHIVECLGVIHLPAVGKFMDNHIVQDRFRCQDEPPVEIEVPGGRTASPAGFLFRMVMRPYVTPIMRA